VGGRLPRKRPRNLLSPTRAREATAHGNASAVAAGASVAAVRPIAPPAVETRAVVALVKPYAPPREGRWEGSTFHPDPPRRGRAPDSWREHRRRIETRPGGIEVDPGAFLLSRFERLEMRLEAARVAIGHGALDHAAKHIGDMRAQVRELAIRQRQILAPGSTSDGHPDPLADHLSAVNP
jgi:hypothetical protein